MQRQHALLQGKDEDVALGLFIPQDRPTANAEIGFFTVANTAGAQQIGRPRQILRQDPGLESSQVPRSWIDAKSTTDGAKN